MSKKQLTNDELLAQFDELNVDVDVSDAQPHLDIDAVKANEPSSSTTTAATAAITPSIITKDKDESRNQEKPEDILAELQDLAAQRPVSRPVTPRTSTSSRQDKEKSARPTAAAATSQEKKLSTPPPPPPPPAATTTTPANDTSPSTDTPSANQGQPSSGSNGGSGSWWGGLFATASAAVKQAEAAVKDIQKNEEAQRWAEQVRGRVGGLKGLGDELRTIALPTFTSLIHTLAPPISSHELLQIHMTHDLQGYPSLDPLIYSVFSRVMAQVEGSDLLVIQRSQEAAPKNGGNANNRTHYQSTAGWDDGPWWRVTSLAAPRSIGAVRDPAVATKLVRASAEDYAREYYSSRGGLEEAMKHASEISSEENPVRNSDIFIALQAINQPVRKDLFQANRTGTNEEKQGDDAEQEGEEEEVCFAIYLHDPVHGINCSTITQSMPQKWIDWLDASPSSDSTQTYPAEDSYDNDGQVVVPDDIADIIESGGVDPREWVADWMRESISLGMGIVAQRYVARRMGVGESSRGVNLRAAPATVIESGAGEAARGL